MPPALLVVGALAAGAVKAVGDNQKAQAQAQEDEFNASVKGQQALQAVAKANEDARISQVHSDAFIGQQRANYGASGVSGGSGSAQDVLQASAANAELDVLNIKHEGDMQAWALRTGAQEDQQSASNARSAGGWAVAGDILGAGVQAGSYASMKH